MSEIKHKKVPKQNLGVKFERIIKECLGRVDDTTFDRIKVAGYEGEKNPADYIVFNSPFQFYFECKAVRGNCLPFWRKGDGDRKANVSQGQVEGLTEKRKVTGVIAGVLVWFIDHDITLFIDIKTLNEIGKTGKSFNILTHKDMAVEVPAEKKRVYFDYDMGELLSILEMKELSIEEELIDLEELMSDDFVDNPYEFLPSCDDIEYANHYIKSLVGALDDGLF